MPKLTLEKFNNLEVGDQVHDMHYGLSSLEMEIPLKVSNHITMPTPRGGGSWFIDECTGMNYCNKMAVVVRVRMDVYGQVATLAYSYDARTFGMFEISEGKDNRGSL